MSPPFVVRRLQLRDAASVRHLAAHLERWFMAEGRTQLARDLTSHSGYVALRGSELLGFLLWTPVDAEVAELSWMGIAEEFHHRGIGTVLLAALLAELKASGFRTLEVATVADNVEYAPYAETRRFYRARGFTDFRVDARYWGSGDDRYDRLVLRRDLVDEISGAT